MANRRTLATPARPGCAWRAVGTAVLMLAVTGSAAAQQGRVELKNGDRISGVIIKMEGGKLCVGAPRGGLQLEVE